MRTWIVCLLTYAALAGCAQAQNPIEIADGRTDGPMVDMSQWNESHPVHQAVETARAYWKERDPSYEEEYRVLGIATGAFTKPDVEQEAVLYLMSLWPRCCPKTGLAIVEGDQLVHNVAFESVVQNLWMVPDLDGDGRDELVFDGTFGMGGQWSRSVTLVSFGDDGLSDWGSTSINDDSCAAGHAGSTAARVTALPGPTFTIEQFTKATCEAETWDPAGEPEPIEFTAPPESPYVKLPLD